MVGCITTTGGVCLNDEENSQIGGSNVAWDARDDGNAGSTAQPVCGFRGTPPSAIVYAVPEFIWGMSDQYCSFALSKTFINTICHKRTFDQQEAD